MALYQVSYLYILPLSMTLIDPLDRYFKVAIIFDIAYLRNDRSSERLNVNRKSYALYRMMTFSMTLTDPEPGFQCHFRDNVTTKH